MFIHRIPTFITQIFPQLIWRMPVIGEDDRRVYFTFDDGPTPEITNFVLEQLDKFNAKATFFCIGKNMVENPELIQLIQSNGHAIGNHTMNHANAWKYTNDMYLENIHLCENVFEEMGVHSIGFRPPYGRMTKSASVAIRKSADIFMWTILTGDYNKDLDPQTVLKKCLQQVKPGDIIVFHDSIKAVKNLKILLPEFLNYCSENNLHPSAL
ncbi:polysaccharide deacetylase family protein [Aquirufa sp. ROCK2-A2]